MSTPRIQFTPRVIAGSILVIIPFVTFVIGMGYAIIAEDKYHSARRVETLTWDAGPAPSVVVDLFEGSVTVAQATDGQVTAQLTKFAVTKAAQATADAALDAIAVDVVRDGETIRIKTTVSPDLKSQFSQLKADIEVRVPPDAGVDLTTGHGYVYIGKIYTGAYGTYPASSPVALRSARARDSGQVYIGIDAEFAPRPGLPPTRLDLQSRHGSVAIRGDNLLIDAQADGGAVQYTGRPAPGTHHLQTGPYVPHVAEPGQIQQGIHLELPADGLFQVDAESPTGAITSDFPGEATTAAGRNTFRSPTGTDAAIKLELRTVDGPIEIRKAPEPAKPIPGATTVPTPVPNPNR